MYTEEFEGLDEAEKGPQTYMSPAQQELERLTRENEKLKKNLEKEKFFNKLLDQELKEVKADAASRYPADYVPPRRGVPAGLFYTVLILFLALAGYTGYTLYYDEPRISEPSIVNEEAVVSDDASVSAGAAVPLSEEASATPSANAISDQPVGNGNADNTVNERNNTTTQGAENKQISRKGATPAVSDSVPEIIGGAARQNQIAARKEPAKKPAAAQPQTDLSTGGNAAQPAPNTDTEEPETQAPPVVQPSRPVIGTYKVNAKANFYNAADENTLRSTFISGNNKTVEALEEKNGFIYVEYNDNGLIKKGWLSKKDLSRAE